MPRSIKPPALPTRKKTVAPPSRASKRPPGRTLSQAPMFPVSDPPTRPRRNTFTATGGADVSLMQIAVEAEKYTPRARRNLLAMMPSLATMFDSTTGEMTERFTTVVSALAPVLQATDRDPEKRMLELISIASRLEVDDQERLIDLGYRLAPHVDDAIEAMRDLQQRKK